MQKNHCYISSFRYDYYSKPLLPQNSLKSKAERVQNTRMYHPLGTLRLTPLVGCVTQAHGVYAQVCGDTNLTPLPQTRP